MQKISGLKRIKYWINETTQRRLIFWSIAFWVISVSALSFIFLWIGQNQMLNESRQRNVQLASMISRDVNSQVSVISESTRIFTQRLEMLNPQLEVQADAMLGLRLSTPRYRALYYFSVDGVLLLHLTDALQSLMGMTSAGQIVNRPAVSLTDAVSMAYNKVKENHSYISEVYNLPMDYLPVLYIGLPVNFSTGETRVLIFEVDLSDIWQRISMTSVGQTGITYVVSREGTIISHPEPSYIGRQIPSEIRPVLESYEGVADYYESFKKSRIIASYSPVGGATGWGIVVEQEEAEAYAPIIRAGTLIGIIWVALGLAGTALIFFLIRNFTRPIQELTNTARNIARTGYLAKTGMIERTDEIGQLSQAFDQMIERINEAQKAKEEAALAERTRLARELHDAVSQTLFSTSLIAEVLPRLWERNPEEGRKRLEEVRQLTRGALAEMRTLLFELRPSALRDVELRDLLKQLGESVIGRARIPVSLDIQGECSIPPEVKISLYRLCQEALNNIVKHSGATEAGIVLICAPGRVELRISDNGRGFDTGSVRAGSLGLSIMKERAEAIGAELRLESGAGKGTMIFVFWKDSSASVS